MERYGRPEHRVKGIYQALGYRVGTLARHYMLNDAIADYRLARARGFANNPQFVSGAKPLELDRDNFWAATDGLDLDGSNRCPAKAAPTSTAATCSIRSTAIAYS